MEDLLQRAHMWLAKDFDAKTKAALQTLLQQGDMEAIKACCGQRLAFGTAGLRGIMGPGPNRINRLVMRETCQGIFQVLKQQPQARDNNTLWIGFDGRIDSATLAQDCVAMALHHGFTIYAFQEPIPTPLLAFAMLEQQALAGLMITASHNPPQYNGIKLFWHNGAQIVPPIDSLCMQAIEQASQQDVASVSLPRQHSNLHLQDSAKWQQAYCQAMCKSLPLRSSTGRKPLIMAYSPLHGVAGELTQTLLQTAGFSPCHMVPSQQAIDGTFPTLPFPNPEEQGVMDRVCALGQQQQAHTAVAHDPDGDRLCVALPNEQGQWQVLSGDMLGILLAQALLERTPANKRKQAALGTTIVSSRMLAPLAAHYGAQAFQTLTGFKWLIAASLERRAQGQDVLLTYEEALGYAVTPMVRDKDGLSALLLWADMVAECLQTGQTLWQRLGDLYKQLGGYFTGQQTITLTGQDGPGWMARLRQQGPQPTTDWGSPIASMFDLQDQQTAQQWQVPCSDVLGYYLSDQSRIIIRPSGTEPKLKCYYEVYLPPPHQGSFTSIYQQGQQQLQNLQQHHLLELQALAERP